MKKIIMLMLLCLQIFVISTSFAEDDGFDFQNFATVDSDEELLAMMGFL